MSNLTINARFLVRPASGVDRVAVELISSLAARADVHKLILLHPRCNKLHLGWLEALPASISGKIALKQVGRLTGHLWEQLELPFFNPGSPLLSLCNTGPVFRRSQIVMIHDSQVWDAPQSYSLPFRILYRILLPVLSRVARTVLTVSHFSAGRLEELGVVPKGKTKVIENGADHILCVKSDGGIYSRIGVERGQYFLAIGSLAPHKNLRMLVDAASRREHGAPELIVAGGMNAQVFADAGLKEVPGVRFIGRVTDGELRALYEGAIALAFPSLTEGFGLPPVEAMLCGCPVIATTGGAVPEICGDAAVYVDPHDTEGWVQALALMGKSSDLRDVRLHKGYAVARKYQWSASATKFLSILRHP